MPSHYSQRSPGDLDLAMRFLQVDRSWYENYWLEEPQPAESNSGRSCRRSDRIGVSLLRRVCSLLAQMRSADCIEQGPLSGANRKTFARIEFFSV